MKTIQLQLPSSINIGNNLMETLPSDSRIMSSQRLLFLTAAPLAQQMQAVIEPLKKTHSVQELIYDYLGEPTFELFGQLLDQLTGTPDCVIGTGGGSVLDCAKLLAALGTRKQQLTEVIGMQLVNRRTIQLICIPTTAGTGSEMSPNAILLNAATQAKSAVISRELVPDAVYIDPSLTLALPARITAETGMDALSHCIESYTNINAHPVIDLYALEGIRLIAGHLRQAVADGTNIDARTALLVGSMYGGICLGPVNTAAVHALSYGLGGKFHIGHGLANAMLLPPVFEFNAPASEYRHASVARALGATAANPTACIAEGAALLRSLASECGIPAKLSDIGIPEGAIPELVATAMEVTRLLNNNPRKMTPEDAETIYRQLF